MRWLGLYVYGVCNRGFATCERVELITINALQMSHGVAKIRCSFTKEPSIRESKADIPSNSYSQSRGKRWIFTSFLASISGLADEEEIKKLEKTAENLGHVELDNAGEIVKLESKSNEIVERISKQNERLTKLFKDEQGLNSKLQDIMSEDASISRQLSSTVRSLEVVADLNLEYSVLASIIELIPVLLTECRMVVHSLYDGILPNEILEAAWKKGSINKDTAKHVSENLTSERVTIRKSPKTCVEKLALGEFKTLPAVCNGGLKLSLCERQEYFRQGSRMYIFSPFNDTVIVDCAGKQNWLPMKAGTVVIRSAHCLTSTSDLLIPSTGIVGKPILITGVMKDFENTLVGLDSVLDDISVSHAISLSNQTTFLSSFLESAKTESVDLGSAATELKKFKTVDFLSNYTVFDFNMDMQLGITNAVTGAYMSLAVMMFLISFLCCCTCKCFRSAVFKLLGALWDIIWDVFSRLVVYLWKLITGSASTGSQNTTESTSTESRNTTRSVSSTELSNLPGSNVLVSSRGRRKKNLNRKTEGASPNLRPCSSSVSEAASDRTFDPSRNNINAWRNNLRYSKDDKQEAVGPPQVVSQVNQVVPCSEPEQVHSGTESELNNDIRRWRETVDDVSEWGAEDSVSSSVQPPKHQSTPLPLYSLGHISGHTAGEYAKIRQVGEYRLWSINYNKLLNRADTRKEDLASPWRIECYSDGSMKCAVGASFEELEFVYDRDLIGSKIINKSGLEVFVKRPELFVVNKFSNLLRDKENNLPSVLGSDTLKREVTLDGIWVHIFCTECDWSLYW
jgi:hypothetical protein